MYTKNLKAPIYVAFNDLVHTLASLGCMQLPVVPWLTKGVLAKKGVRMKKRGVRTKKSVEDAQYLKKGR